MISSLTNETITKLEQELEAACAHYCAWYDRGDASYASGIAYDLVSTIRRVLSLLRSAPVSQDVLDEVRREIADWRVTSDHPIAQRAYQFCAGRIEEILDGDPEPSPQGGAETQEAEHDFSNPLTPDCWKCGAMPNTQDAMRPCRSSLSRGDHETLIARGEWAIKELEDYLDDKTDSLSGRTVVEVIQELVAALRGSR